MDALAVPLVGLERLSVEMPIVRRIVAVYVLVFKEIRPHVRQHKMSNDTVDYDRGATEQVSQLGPVRVFLEGANLKRNIHRGSAKEFPTNRRRRD